MHIKANTGLEFTPAEQVMLTELKAKSGGGDRPKQQILCGCRDGNQTF